MRKQYILIATLISVFTAGSVVRADSVDIEYSVKATMHTVEGTAEARPFQAETNDQSLSVSIEVPIESMETGNKKRDKEMHHVLREDLQPVLKGVLQPTPLAQFHPDEDEAGTIPLVFSMADQSLPVEAEVTDWEESEEAVSFTVTFDLSQKAYGLEPISKMGFLKVDDVVHVVAHFELDK